MPLAAPVISQAILAASPDLTGVVWVRMVAAIGIGVASWAVIPSNLTLQGISTGSAGSGNVTGKVYVTPASLPVNSAVALAALLGLDAARVARAIGIGIGSAFTAGALYQGVSVGVGTGVDVSKITVANGPTLTGALCLGASSTALVGVDIPRIMTGLGPGIAALLLTGTGTGAVAGSVSPAPASGTTLSRVY